MDHPHDQNVSTAPVPFLSYGRFRFRLRVLSHLVLPPYKGSVFRGAFGSAFRRAVCAARQAECPTCILRHQCLYVAFFESPPPPSHPEAAKFRQAPRPYVLNPPLTIREIFAPGDMLDFELVLIGRALEALPYCVHIFIGVGQQGLGRGRGRFELVQVDLMGSQDYQTIYQGSTKILERFQATWGPAAQPGDDDATRATLHFLTPLRLKEKSDLVTRVTFPLLLQRLLQRLSFLAACHEKETQFPGFDPLLTLASSVTVTRADLSWYDWQRFSRRQESLMKFGGLRGRLTIEGPLGPFLPYLRLGAQVNVGQETTFGLGRYELVVEL